jgi:hypothetical protein
MSLFCMHVLVCALQRCAAAMIPGTMHLSVDAGQSKNVPGKPP